MDTGTRARLLRQLEEINQRDRSFTGSPIFAGRYFTWLAFGGATFFLSALIAGWWPVTTGAESLYLFLAIFLCLGVIFQSLYRITRDKLNQRLRGVIEALLAEEDQHPSA
jgi:hypothetical protein